MKENNQDRKPDGRPEEERVKEAEEIDIKKGHIPIKITLQ
jgi:hypothetical protein